MVDGLSIFDLGCGWGSLTLYILEKFRTCKVYSLTNSKTQREHIVAEAKKLGVEDRLTVFVENINTFELTETLKVDRIMSIEMMEHCRNYELLFERITRWLKPEGLIFIHIFVFQYFTYHFDDPESWMDRHFFSGGSMPSESMLLRYQKHMTLERQWKINGTEYSKTSEAWLKNMDDNIEEVRKIFSACYGKENVNKWIARWRTFFIGVSESFGYDNGNAWYVSHYLFKKR